MFRYLYMLNQQKSEYKNVSDDNKQENYEHIVSQVKVCIRYSIYYFFIMTIFRTVIMFKSYQDMSYTNKVGLIWLAILIDRFGDVFRFAIGYATEALCAGNIYRARTSKNKDEIHAVAAVSLFNSLILCILSTIMFIVAAVLFDKIKCINRLNVNTVLLLTVMLIAKIILVLNGILRLINDSFGKRPYSAISTIVQISLPQVYYMAKIYWLHMPITIYDIVISSFISSISAIIINMIIYYAIFRKKVTIQVYDTQLTSYLRSSINIVPGYIAKYTSRLAFTELITIASNLHVYVSVTDMALMYGVYRNLSGYFESPSTTGNRTSVRFAHNNIALLKGFIISNYILWSIYLIFIVLISRIHIGSLFYINHTISKVDIIIIICATLVISIYKSIESFNSTLLRNRFYNLTLTISEIVYLAYYIYKIKQGIIDISISMLIRHTVYLALSFMISIYLDSDNSFTKSINTFISAAFAHIELFCVAAIYIYYF